MRGFIIIVKVLLLILFYLQGRNGFSQVVVQSNSNQDKALELLDKAIGDVFGSQDIGIYFEGITFGAKKPEDIFSMPVYKVFRGGYLFVKENQFEMELGLMKAVSDGKVMVIVDEQQKTMIIDSVKKQGQSKKGDKELLELVDDDFKDGHLSYEGIVTLNNIKCHKIIANVNSSVSSQVIYWVDVANEKIYLMAEKQGETYNVYWFSKIGKLPANHIFNVFLPKKTLTTFHGYRVIDNRFISE